MAITYSTQQVEKICARYPERVTAAFGDPHFALWLLEVDRHVSRRIGVTHRDMPDRPWRDQYDDEVPAQDAALDAIEEWIADGDLPGLTA